MVRTLTLLLGGLALAPAVVPAQGLAARVDAFMAGPGASPGAPQELAEPGNGPGGSQALAGGLPGIDGLNASTEALGRALAGADPAVLRALLSGVDPAVRAHIAGSLDQPLAGLEVPTGRAAGLPGIDGLPMPLPRGPAKTSP